MRKTEIPANLEMAARNSFNGRDGETFGFEGRLETRLSWRFRFNGKS